MAKFNIWFIFKTISCTEKTLHVFGIRLFEMIFFVKSLYNGVHKLNKTGVVIINKIFVFTFNNFRMSKFNDRRV